MRPNELARVICVHGVGVGPEAFGPLGAALGDNDDIDVDVVTRPGYRFGEIALPLDRQVDLIGDHLARTPTHTASVWVGVSGGATLGLLAAERIPRLIDCAILHEPLAGSLTPEIQALIAAAADRLHRAGSAIAAVEFVEQLVGAETWARLGTDGRSQVTARAAVILREVSEFASYEPDLEALASAGVEIIITTGARSTAARARAAEIVAGHVGGTVVTIPEAGHLPHVDVPETFARLIRSLS